MKTSIKKLPDSKIEILVEVSSKDFNRYYKRALLDLGKEIKIKGFRPGHVPSDILEKEISQEEILNHAAQEAIKDKLVGVINDNDLEVIEKPRIEILKLALKNPLIFKAQALILPEIKLLDYKKAAASVKKKKSEVKVEEIEKAVKWLQRSRAKFIALRREARKGDFVEIEYWSSQIEAGKKKKDSFILDQGHFIPGFEEKLEGMKAGESKEEFSLVVPEGHFMKDLAGKEVKFGVKMISVFKTELPELNDNFAKSLGDFKDLASLKQDIKKGLEIEKEKEIKEKLREEILEKIINSVSWEIPELLIETEKDRLFNNFKKSFSQVTDSQISFRSHLSKIKKSEEEVRKSFLEPAQRNVKAFLALREIAKKENIKISEEERDKEINEIFKKYPSLKTAKNDLDLKRLRQYTEERMINEKVFQLLEKLSEEI